MPTESSIEISPSDLVEIVQAVFEVMLGLEAIPDEPYWLPSENSLTAAVRLTGAWNGAVLVQCDAEQACRFAASYLSIDPPDTVNDVVRDALGELANVIGGNLKCVLSRGIHISLPTVVAGNDYRSRVPGEEVRWRIGFDCSEGPFGVVILATRS